MYVDVWNTRGACQIRVMGFRIKLSIVVKYLITFEFWRARSGRDSCNRFYVRVSNCSGHLRYHNSVMILKTRSRNMGFKNQGYQLVN